MTRWFRFYDDVINDPKVLSLPDASRWAWVAMLCAASKNDGALPAADHLGLMLRVTKQRAIAIIATLHAAGLLDKTETGFAPHNWNGRQYKSDVSTERVQRFRNGKRNVSETPPDTDTDTDTERPSVAKSARAKKRAVVLPADWVPSVKSYAIAEQFGQNVQIVEGIFRDYVASSGKLYADHDAAFHNFIRNQSSFNRGSSNGTPQNKSVAAVAKRFAEQFESQSRDGIEGGPDAFLRLPAG